ncbi:hypothetical protein ACFQ9R_01080 [Nocardia sp. NPDC056541]|uniref:hypothetical protein n=1 Tax=unclassified Nocardia TaxID=2637762 RepID=UPI00366F23D0
MPTAEVAVGDFYSTSMPLPDVAAGAVIRTEPAHLALSAPGQPEMIPASAALDASQRWMTDRLAGQPAPTNCARLP